MHGSPGQGVQGRLPVFKFHDGLSPLICPTKPSHLSGFPVSTRPHPFLHSCISSRVQQNKLEALQKIRKSRALFLFFWFFFMVQCKSQGDIHILSLFFGQSQETSTQLTDAELLMEPLSAKTLRPPPLAIVNETFC